MKNSLSKVVQHHQRSLRRESFANFVKLLRRVCQVHYRETWAVAARPHIEHLYKCMHRNVGDRKAAVLALFTLADSFSSAMHEDARTHFGANQFSALIKKYPYPKSWNPFTPQDTAWNLFQRNEHRCRRLNSRFKARRSLTGRAQPFEPAFHQMRSLISYILGDQPDLRQIFDQTGFGPGANVGVNSMYCNLARKLASQWTVTPGAYMYGFASFMKHAQLRELMFPNPGGFTKMAEDYDPYKGPFSKKIQLVTYNKLAFVPKTAKIDRSIAIEPLINGFLQKGVDNVMRLRLKRYGIDLSLQEPNSQMAYEGSLDESEDGFVTIDLSAASDSISIELCRELLPPDWFDFLNSIRSKNYTYKKELFSYNKFCSMGNGFCFPLETLLFVSACFACGCGRPGIDYRVYGDDIIVRRRFAAPVLSLLGYMGFKANLDKTFLSGPFRESCGTDWYRGVDVRPYTLDFALDSIQNIFKILNGSLRSELCANFFAEVRPFLIGRIPGSCRLFRPFPGPDDSAITAVGDEFLTSQHTYYRFKDGCGAWYWKELIPVPIADREINKWARGHDSVMLYGALTGYSSSQPFSIRRKTRTKVRVISHPGSTSQWIPPAGMEIYPRRS